MKSISIFLDVDIANFVDFRGKFADVNNKNKKDFCVCCFKGLSSEKVLVESKKYV